MKKKTALIFTDKRSKLNKNNPITFFSIVNTENKKKTKILEMFIWLQYLISKNAKYFSESINLFAKIPDNYFSK